MLTELFAKAKAENADMVICDFYLDTKSGGVICKQAPKLCTAECVLEQLMFQQLHGSCCNKLVRRVCYSEHNVAFPPQIIRWEDLFVNCCLLMNPLKISYLGKAFYHYDQMSNPNSIVRKPTIQGLQSQIYFIDHFKAMGVSDDILLMAIFATKELAYVSGMIKNSEIISLYAEVNERYLKERPNTEITIGLKELIKGHTVNACIMRHLLLIYYWFRNRLKI